MCAGNTKSLHEPDIRCSAPAHGRAHAAQIHGRSATQCCLTEGMCIGNSDPATDVVCVAPAVLKPVSHSCACIGSPCLRQCVHGASIGRFPDCGERRVLRHHRHVHRELRPHDRRELYCPGGTQNPRAHAVRIGWVLCHARHV
jgi:hypothetical protein